MALFTDTRLITERQFRDLSGIGDVDDFEPYQHPLFVADEIFVQRFIGNNQFDRLVIWNTLTGTARTDDVNNVANQALLDRLINWIAFQGLYIRRTNRIDYSDSGTSVWSGGDNNNATTEDETEKSAQAALEMANTFKMRASRWIRENEVSYPLIGESDDGEVMSDLSADAPFVITNL